MVVPATFLSLEDQMLPSLMIVAVLALTVYGQLMMKARALTHATPIDGSMGKLQYLIAMFGDIGVLSSLGAAGLASAFWMLVIERMEVNYAYPFIALNFVLVPFGSMMLFGERLPPLQVLGLGLIVLGVTVSSLAR
jgi:multidrug transporter EmrE-like cation transporter